MDIAPVLPVSGNVLLLNTDSSQLGSALMSWSSDQTREPVYKSDFILPLHCACFKDTDIQWGWNLCIVGCGEWAAAAELPRTRGWRALSGSGSIWNRKHLCVGGENSSPPYQLPLQPHLKCWFFSCCRAAIRRPTCGICVQDSASSPLKHTNQT